MNTYPFFSKINGALPAAKRGWSDITARYVREFGVPPVGQRVFIRTRQLLNGWQDDFKDHDSASH